jgi:hypothetical protein
VTERLQIVVIQIAEETMRKPRLARTTLVLLLGITTGMASPPPATADLGDLICTAAAQLNFTPPLDGATSADAELTATFTNCISLNGYTTLQSATITGNAEAVAVSGTPCALVLTVEGQATADWSPATQNSTLDFTFDTNPLDGTAGITVDVTSGPLAGDTMTPVLLEINPNLDCATAGLKSLTSVAFLAVFS